MQKDRCVSNEARWCNIYGQSLPGRYCSLYTCHWHTWTTWELRALGRWAMTTACVTLCKTKRIMKKLGGNLMLLVWYQLLFICLSTTGGESLVTRAFSSQFTRAQDKEAKYDNNSLERGEQMKSIALNSCNLTFNNEKLLSIKITIVAFRNFFNNWVLANNGNI